MMTKAETRYQEWLEKFAKARNMTKKEAGELALAKVVRQTFMDDGAEKKRTGGEGH